MRRGVLAHLDDDNIVTGTWILFFSRVYDQLKADFRRGMISGESKTGQSQLANDWFQLTDILKKRRGHFIEISREELIYLTKGETKKSNKLERKEDED